MSRNRVLLSLLMLSACTASVDPTDRVGSPGPTAVAEALPCDSTVMPRLIGPDGSQVALGDGFGASTWISNEGLTHHLRQLGECVWITGVLDADLSGGDEPFLTSFLGRLGADFRIVGQFADLTGAQIPGFDSGSWAYEVTFEDGSVVLIEDRASGGPPGCSGGEGVCPEPRSLYRIEDLQVSSETFEPPFTAVLPPDWHRDGNTLFPADAENQAIEFARDNAVMAATCDLEPAAGVGSAAADLVGALAARDGLEVTEPQAVTLGGLSGFQIDFAIRPDWTGACPWTFGSPFVPLMGVFDDDGINAGFMGAEAGERFRYIVLDVPGGGTVHINVYSREPADAESHFAIATWVLDSLEFNAP